MYRTANGAKTERVMTSCMTLSCERLNCEWPMRLAGTWSKYSKQAIPQLRSAAMYHGRSLKFFKWAYQAKVIKMFDAASNNVVLITTGMRIESSWGTAYSNLRLVLFDKIVLIREMKSERGSALGPVLAGYIFDQTQSY